MVLGGCHDGQIISGFKKKFEENVFRSAKNNTKMFIMMFTTSIKYTPSDPQKLSGFQIWHMDLYV